jgi:16S rRNA processing protein RimM
VVERADGTEVLIPFVEEIVVEIDLEKQRAVIDPPPGLIDDRAEIASSRDADDASSGDAENTSAGDEA